MKCMPENYRLLGYFLGEIEELWDKLPKDRFDAVLEGIIRIDRKQLDHNGIDVGSLVQFSKAYTDLQTCRRALLRKVVKALTT